MLERLGANGHRDVLAGGQIGPVTKGNRAKNTAVINAPMLRPHYFLF